MHPKFSFLLSKSLQIPTPLVIRGCVIEGRESEWKKTGLNQLWLKYSSFANFEKKIKIKKKLVHPF